MTTIETQLVALRDLADAGLPVHEATRVRLTKAFRLKTFYRCPRCDANSTEVFRHPNGTNTFNCWGCMFKFEWTDMLTEDGSGDDLILIIVDAAIAAEAGDDGQHRGGGRAGEECCCADSVGVLLRTSRERQSQTCRPSLERAHTDHIHRTEGRVCTRGQSGA